MAQFVSDVGPTPASLVGSTAVRSGSGRIVSLARSADAQRIYAGSYAGVWRSDDAGRTFRQMSRPQPGTHDADVAGALHAPHIFDLAVSPADPDIVLAAAVRSQFAVPADGVWRSTDGGASWTLVQPAFRVSQIAFAPDDPDLVIASLGVVDPIFLTLRSALAISHDAGAHWSVISLSPAWHIAIGPLEASGVRRVYAAGDNKVWYSIDGGAHWRADFGAAVVKASRDATSAFIVANSNPDAAIPAFAGRTGDVGAAGPQALAIEPGNPLRIYLAAQGGTFGLSYFAVDKNGNPIPDGTEANVTPIRLAGEGSMWTADFSGFEASQAAQWEAVPGPPLYSGATTPSGLVYVQAHPTPSGYLLFFADQSSVYVSVGRPLNSIQWHRLDGWDASADKRAGGTPHEHVLVHVDPHAFLASPDLDLTLKPAAGVPTQYDQNSELDQHLGGTMWMANDGGVEWSDDGGVTWTPAAGLPTLDPINIAGLAGVGGAPALYIGTGDNDSFFTTDGGTTWRDSASHLGDADGWFADPARADWVLQIAPQSRGGPGVFIVRGGPYPNAGDSGNFHGVPPPAESTFSSGFVLAGYAPLVRTLATEAAPPDGDVVVIGKRSDGKRVVFRTQAISSISDASHWEDPAHAQQLGPPLPDPAPSMVVGVVQASGGHLNPDIFVSDTVSLWKLDRAAQAWQVLVPGGPTGRSAAKATRFWVDPFNPLLIYLLDSDRFRVSLDGGASWLFDAELTAAISGGGKLALTSNGVVRDMLFVRTERFTHFAFGSAGVMCTVDGIQWQTLLNAIALGGCPESAFFDGITDPLDRTLYVEFEGRSILRITGVPAPPVLSPPDFSLLDLTAVLGEA
jgi:hypothetical protein